MVPYIELRHSGWYAKANVLGIMGSWKTHLIQLHAHFPVGLDMFNWANKPYGWDRCQQASFIRGGGGILDKTHPSDFGPTQTPPLLQFCGEHFL